MGADSDVYNACIDVILPQWINIPVYTWSISIHIKVKVIDATSSCQDFSHKT